MNKTYLEFMVSDDSCENYLVKVERSNADSLHVSITHEQESITRRFSLDVLFDIASGKSFTLACRSGKTDLTLSQENMDYIMVSVLKFLGNHAQLKEI